MTIPDSLLEAIQLRRPFSYLPGVDRRSCERVAAAARPFWQYRRLTDKNSSPSRK